MQPFDVATLLSYGAIGLGCVLAILAYLLLKNEQSIARPRASMLQAIYVFMGFSLVLSAAGFVSEFLRSDAATAMTFKKQLEEKTNILSTLDDKYRNMNYELSSSRHLLRTLMDLKSGKVASLKSLDPRDPMFSRLVREIQKDLEDIDEKMASALIK